MNNSSEGCLLTNIPLACGCSETKTQLDCKCLAVDTPQIKSIPKEMDHSVAKVHRKFTNPECLFLAAALKLNWIVLYIGASILIDQKKEGNLLSNIPDALSFLILTVTDVVKRHWVTLLAPTIVSALFMYAYLLIVRGCTKFFTIVVMLLITLASAYICIISVGYFFSSFFKTSENGFEKASIFIQNPLFAFYFLAILIYLLKTHSVVIEIFEDTLSAFFHCIIPVLFVIPAFIFLYLIFGEVISLDCALSHEDIRFFDTLRYFLRGFNWFMIIYIMNLTYNYVKIIIVQYFTHWYRTKGKQDLSKNEIIENIKTVFEILYYHMGTVVYESIPIVPNLRTFILILNWKEQPSKNSENSENSENLENVMARFICKVRLILEINDFVLVHTSIYGYDFDKSAKKAINILLQNSVKYIATLDVFYIIRIFGLSVIVYLFCITFSRDILYYNGYLLEGNKPHVEEINQMLIFVMALIIATLALVLDFVVSTGLKVILLCSVGDLFNNNYGICKKTLVNESSV